jgi:Ca2+/Na+ antiporter
MLTNMDATLLKGLVALIPACILLAGSAILFLRGETVSAFLQLLGAGCLVVVVLTHLCEALHLFPWMHWGDEHSVGHYLDLGSAVLGLTLFPVGYLLNVVTDRRT